MGGIVSSAGETLCEKKTPSLPPASQPAADAAVEPPLLIIERRTGWRAINLAELWRFRELLYFLTWRDVKVRYKQTVLGAAWAVLQPLATTVVFTVFLGKVAKVPAGEWQDKYALFVFAGMLPWTFLATGITNAGQSVVGSQNLVTKVYFPRLFIPMGAVGVCLVDFAIAFALLLVLGVGYGVPPGWGLLLVPLLILLLVVLTVGVGTLLASLTVAYRDFRYVVPFAVQLWMFATPSIYMDTAASLGSRWQALLPLNPAYGLVAAFRQAVLGGAIDLYSLGLSSAISLALLVIGCMYFARVERSFADII
jgi:lipopolysaccharide transport system permease protein